MTSTACPAGHSSLFCVSQLKQLLQFVLSGKRSWWMVGLLWLMAMAPARAELELRVAIEQDVSQVKVGSSTDAVLRDLSGQELATVPGMNAVMAEAKQGKVAVSQLQANALWVDPKDQGYVFIDDKWYRGRTLVVPTSGGLTAVNYVDLENYLYSVVGGEMPASWNLEALKAQAVAARSYALYQRQHGGNDIFDVGNTTAWQVYGGLEKEAPSTRAAVDATQGQVLTYSGQIINAVFHSCAGGYTENVEDVWVNPLPYLRAVRSPDENAAGCQWEPMTLSADEMSQQLGYDGAIASIDVQRNAYGRAEAVRVTGSAGTKTLSGEDIRDDLGLKSTLFSIESIRGRVASAGSLPASPSFFRVTGSGFGHGIGLSQYGAQTLADQSGWNYQQILLHYYTGATLAKIQVQ